MPYRPGAVEHAVGIVDAGMSDVVVLTLASFWCAFGTDNLLVVDLDRPLGRPDPLPLFVERWGDDCRETMTSSTGGGGWHLFCRVDEQRPTVYPGKDRLGNG